MSPEPPIAAERRDVHVDADSKRHPRKDWIHGDIPPLLRRLSCSSRRRQSCKLNYHGTEDDQTVEANLAHGRVYRVYAVATFIFTFAHAWQSVGSDDYYSCCSARLGLIRMARRPEIIDSLSMPRTQRGLE